MTRLALPAFSFLLFPLLLGSAAPQVVTEPAGCRDATGEPIPCAATSPPPPPAPAGDAHTHRGSEAGYVDVYPYLDVIDLGNVRFTPDTPHSVPEIERGSHLEGFAHDFDQGMGGITLGFGYRPVPWLRLPDARFTFGYGDFAAGSVDVVGGAQALTAALHDCWMVRAQIGGGVDIDVDPVRFYALGHVSVGGYFLQVDVNGSSIGSLGSDTYSATSLEAGWTAGMEIELDPDIAYTFGYRHVHTGVEQNTFFFGVNIRIR